MNYNHENEISVMNNTL